MFVIVTCYSVLAVLLCKDTPGDIVHAKPPDSKLLVTPVFASQSASTKLVGKQAPDPPEPGRGEVNYAATWDEFPNGRFGDFKSPAFGMSDLWSATGLGVSVRIHFLLRICYWLTLE